MKDKAGKYPPSETKPDALAEAMTPLAYGGPIHVSVRAAKDRFSSLLELAASGREVLITSDGEPKAKLISTRMKPKKLKVNWALLRSMPLKPDAKRSEEIIREERDGRS